ncbi:hypothetical protein NK55_00945 [Thermosynechococcus sp. NK55a]|jgi:uncharacterized membrane protein YebE (DUF533 family)|uniref:hypothetical protein n=1 Tax=unclassified Thermosynechococcus TaxID=2622553 RepID=UPI0003D89221|nr:MULTISPECIES: hypothetical protein [unclassified Thermosynechococcus]AHB87571.1 hypothetical protein NK55_00945 [Thermosynechococcus sp. NK55a]RMH66918.1 MAG: hypothetical protein D6676_03635 [Cyanobacteria bacterium J003]HIK23290.1 hypothetical protein [Thermosynechococcus sp. M3746_W2019_013]
MERYQPNGIPLSKADKAELAKLKKLLERAIADGVLTADEMGQIKQQIRADGKVTYEELELYRQFVEEKIRQGLLVREIC